MDNIKMLKAMFAEATIGILVVNAKGEIVQANPFSEKLFGYNSGELIFQKLEILLPQSFRTRHTQHRENYHENPVPRTMGANLELFGQRKDGSHFPIEISLSHMEIDGERFAIAYTNDDSIRKNIFRDLQNHKNLLDEAQGLAHVGSFEIDVISKNIQFSKEMYRIYGLDPEKDKLTYGDSIYFIHPDDREFIIENHRKILEEKRGLNFGYRIITKEKEVRYVEGKRSVKLDEDGNVLKIFGMIQDITDLKEAKSINEDISKIVEESLNEIFIFHAETLKFIQVNKGALKNLGYTLEEVRKLTPIDIKPEYEEKQFLELLLPLKNSSKKELLFETIHERKDKTTYPVEVHLQLSRLGKDPAYVAFISDISERKKYEKKILGHADELERKVIERTEELRKSESKLRKSYEKEKQLGELKSRFVSMASHEFRTPLSSILSSANLIGRYEKGEDHAKRMKHVNRIESSVKNLNSILNDFLSLEKLESGKVRANPVEFKMDEYIQQIMDEMSLITKENQKIVHFHQGKNEIVADEHLVKNILINLLSNGIKYSPKGKNVELHTQNENGNIKIQVKDFGIGIPEEDQEHMFTRFFRAKNVTNIQGTGLGLTIVKRYLDLLNGKIWFESQPEKGTTFFVEIPKMN